MWQTTEPPLDTRLLASVKGKVWIGRYRPRWPDFKTNEWSFDGKTMNQTKTWVVDGWQELPKAINAKPKPPNTYWHPTCYFDALELSVRASNALQAAGLKTKEQIMSLTEESLLALPNVGNLTCQEILEVRHKPNPEILSRLPFSDA